MTDIVERLRKTASRGVSVWGDLQMEAAEEIDALRARLAQPALVPLTKDQIDFITSDSFLAANGGVYSTRVYDFAGEVIAEFCRANGIAPPTPTRN